ncbi:MAG: N-acetylglucosamine-6-phosphate deacetylase [Actinomycetota bacterium]|nr:N-acetylglucosamine-6-phosphate deacetylase [Actinomycetota bacterium]
MENIILINGTILTPFEKLKNKILFLKDGKIERLISKAEFDNNKDFYKNDYRLIDVEGYYIAPGFIDIHTHGANNIDATTGPYDKMADFLVKYGITGFLPTFWNASISTLIKACKNISIFIEKQKKGSRVLGINSEGPYLNPNFGAQDPINSIIPKFEDYDALIKSSGNNLKLMTVAPEIHNAEKLIKYLRLNNIVVAICYTEMSTEQLYKSIDWGVTHIGHIFDGFGESIAKDKWTKPYGLQEELLVCDNLMSEVLADNVGAHVHPTWLKIILRCKGIDKIILISDSRDIAGNSPGTYRMSDGFDAIIKKGEDIVRLVNGGGLAGCIMTLNVAIKNMIKHTGIEIKDAVRMATYNPAKAINISNKKGEIKVGMDADIVVFNEEIEVKLTIINGLIEHNDKSI